jgi:hypothetical protein
VYAELAFDSDDLTGIDSLGGEQPASCYAIFDGDIKRLQWIRRNSGAFVAQHDDRAPLRRAQVGLDLGKRRRLAENYAVSHGQPRPDDWLRVGIRSRRGTCAVHRLNRRRGP